MNGTAIDSGLPLLYQRHSLYCMVCCTVLIIVPLTPGFAALIELAAEPFYVLALVNLQFKLRWVGDEPMTQ